MQNLKSWLLTFLGLCMLTIGSAHINPNAEKPQKDKRVKFRTDCTNAKAQIDMQINNVQARLLAGGDVWWDGTGDGRYVVPNVPPGVPERSSIFAGAVWLGGVDPSGALKIAAQTYGTSTGESDFYPGPLDPETGRTNLAVCAQWDRFFVVDAENIDLHLAQYNQALERGEPYDPNLIPAQIKQWPARGNQFFAEEIGYDLPNTNQGLAGFWDQNGNGLYEPDDGDYPIIEIRGCNEPQYPDQMIFWVYNDAGNVHEQTGSETPIQMEIQVQAFAYRTNDEVNNMTFQRYKLINRAIESIDSTFFAMWVDPDLGCYTDDYIGCDVSRSLAYVYNEDALDGQAGCDCPQGINTYCDDVPILGVDYFRGPLDENGDEIGMSSFTYFNNNIPPTPPPGTIDPNTTIEYYNYLSGTWRDGTPFTFGGDAYQDTNEEIDFAFVDPPNSNGWSMCGESLPPGDRRTVQASGPFRLDPGAVNELIIGVVWVPDQNYPCPSIRRLQQADDIAQSLFDNCFALTRGPDAPDMDFIELDRELIVILTNDTLIENTNNPFESYMEEGLTIPEGEEDNEYVFEGYQVYQLAGPSVSFQDERDDPDKVRLVFQTDVQNNIGKLFNWEGLNEEDTPTENEFFIPVEQVDGANEGIRTTFRITEDQFAEGDRRLINHKRYYFVAVAYAFNEYEPFDPSGEGTGQRIPYLEGDRNIGDGEFGFYTVIPRPITDRKLNASFGSSVEITRTDGLGNGGKFLRLSDDYKATLETEFAKGERFASVTPVVYAENSGPFDIEVFNPLDVVDGEYELKIIDSNLEDTELEATARWQLTNLSDPTADVITSGRTIEELNEQLIKQYGFSITLGQVEDVASQELRVFGNGVIGSSFTYADASGPQWLAGVEDTNNATLAGIFDYALTELGGEDESLDPNQDLTNIAGGFFMPYALTDYRNRPSDVAQFGYIGPAWSDQTGGGVVRNQPLARLSNLPNVDIVFTSNKDLWSRCVVIETANASYENDGFTFTEGGRTHFDLRASPNVTKFDNDGDGLPDIDTEDPGEGMGWFPGYAVDVETGQRLNIFFGENSLYTDLSDDPIFGFYSGRYTPNGRDMMFNPTAETFIPFLEGSDPTFTIFNFVAGGQHMVYVTRTPYDECAFMRTQLDPSQPTSLLKISAVKDIAWTGFPLTDVEAQFTSYSDGLIPNDLTLSLRVNDPFRVEEDLAEEVINPSTADFDDRTGDGSNGSHPAYRFTLEGFSADELDAVGIDEALDQINVVPNPYYGFSDYEPDKFTNIIKITNLPPKCTVTIYSLDGKFIRQYVRDEIPSVPEGTNRAIEFNQITPALEWDLKNSRGIPIASGVYLIHVAADGLGERTLKWFGVNREFDPSGL
ncbi:MAG: hypothetical protein AAF798_15560 [Bacteroidota bacterium]